MNLFKHTGKRVSCQRWIQNRKWPVYQEFLLLTPLFIKPFL